MLRCLVLALLVPPFVNVNRYRSRVADPSAARWAGRHGFEYRTQIAPRPGLRSPTRSGRQPSYGASPCCAPIRSPPTSSDVAVAGRLEIGTLDLDNPSLNLVRRADGHWNVEELVERTAQATSAPTSKLRPEMRPVSLMLKL